MSEQPDALDDTELATVLDQLNRNAVGYLSDELSVDQDNALDRYFGAPFGDEEEGMSQAMSMDVAEVVDWALPDLLEPFISGDRVVEYIPSSKKDEQWVGNAQEMANHVFYVDNDGVTLLHDTIKTALIQKIGFVKCWWQDDEKEERRRLSGVSLLNLQELQSDPNVRIENMVAEAVDAADLNEEAAAAFVDGQSYTVDLTVKRKCGYIKLISCPPEEIKVASRSVELETIDYIAHETETPKWKLVEMGFPADVVAGLQAQKKTESSRADTRFTGETQRTAAATRLEMLDEVTLIEEYPMLDVDGKGVKRWQVFRVGTTVLGKQEVTEHPFHAWTADRIPHRLIGLALADKVKQTQKIKTHLLRDLLNNIYMANRPRIEVPETAIGNNTIKDLLNVRIGGLIRTKQPGQMLPVAVPDRTGSALTAITYIDGVREQQSGITRNGLAISSEVVDPKSAQESRRQDRNEQVRKRLMCRMIAETLLVPLFRHVLRLLVAYQDTPKEIRVAGRWAQMSPKDWNADVKARPSVGLGHSNRDELMQAVQVVGAFQAQAQAMGMATPKHLYKTAEKLIEAVGWRHADVYFVNPDSQEGQAALQQHAQSQGADPKAMEAQAKIQLEGQKFEADQARKAAELEAKTQQATIQAEMDRQIAELNAANELRIAQIRLNAEHRIAQQRLNAEMDLAAFEAKAKAANDAHVAHSKAETMGAGVRFGGKVG